MVVLIRVDPVFGHTYNHINESTMLVLALSDWPG